VPAQMLVAKQMQGPYVALRDPLFCWIRAGSGSEQCPTRSSRNFCLFVVSAVSSGVWPPGSRGLRLGWSGQPELAVVSAAVGLQAGTRGCSA
jgi:hypothetical protein